MTWRPWTPPSRRPRRSRQADPDRLPHDHRQGLARTSAAAHDVHGAPLGGDEIAATREALGWTHEPVRRLPQDAYDRLGRQDATAGAEARPGTRCSTSYGRSASAPKPAEFTRRMRGELPAGFDASSWTPSSPRRRKGRNRSPRARPAQNTHRGLRRRCCRNCWAARPT